MIQVVTAGVVVRRTVLVGLALAPLGLTLTPGPSGGLTAALWTPGGELLASADLTQDEAETLVDALGALLDGE